jgi:paraquat-inducible protein A
MAMVLPGPALWAFMALTVLLTMVTAFDPRRLWEMADGMDEVDGVDDVDDVDDVDEADAGKPGAGDVHG